MRAPPRFLPLLGAALVVAACSGATIGPNDLLDPNVLGGSIDDDGGAGARADDASGGGAGAGGGAGEAGGGPGGGGPGGGGPGGGGPGGGGPGGAGDGGGGGRSARDACVALQQSIHARQAACNGTSVAYWDRLLPIATICDSAAASVAAGRQTYAATRVDACLQRLASMTCSELTAYRGCDAFAATVPAGGACRDFGDCARGWCDTGATCPGVCRAFVGSGQACTATSRCEPGQYCVGITATNAVGACRSLTPIGGACNAQSPSLPPCDWSTSACDAASGRCAALATSGACPPATCAAGYVCAGPNNARTCRRPKAVGQSCTAGQSECGWATQSYCAAGACAAASVIGQTCGYVGTGASTEYAFCAEGYCPARGATTALCARHVPLYGACPNGIECPPLSQCVGGTCRPYVCP